MQRYPGKKALVVDDESSTRLLLKEALEELGIQVTEAVDGADAIHKSLETQFDLATMDILMPNVNGLDAIRAMRTVDPGYRIVVISSCRDDEHRRAVRDLDVPHYIHKPVRLAELYAAVRDELSGAEIPCSASSPGDE